MQPSFMPSFIFWVNAHPLIWLGIFLGLGFLVGASLTLLLTRQKHRLLKQQLQQQSLAHSATQAALSIENTKLATNNQWLTQQIEQAQQQFKQLQQQNQLFNERLAQKNQDFIQLKTQQQASEQYHHKQLQEFNTQKSLLNQEFERLAQKVLATNSAHFSQNQEQSVKLLLEPFQQQLNNFSQQVEQFKNSQISSHANLNTELQHLKILNQQITQEAHTLSLALKGDKKLSGTWGEVQLERSLQAAGLQNHCHYQREANFVSPSGQNRRPDFIIKLPDGKDIIIDSKISLVDFNKAVAATEQADQQQALTQHVKALKKHIDDLAQKDYSALIGVRSPHFVLMFIAIEPAFIEALKHDHNLYDYGAQKNVVLISHTTLMPILKTIANLWLLDRSHSQAFELAEKAGDIYQQVCLVAERLHKLGRSLHTTTSHYNDALTAFAGRQGLYGKVERFGEVAKQQQPLPELEPLASEIDTHRLTSLIE